MDNRKTDRRTIYTINVIKDAFLELIDKEPYSKINVAKLCRKAEITRSTFYLHFDNLTDVLNVVLDDALLFTNESDEIPTIEKKPALNSFEENESLIPK